MEGSSLKMKRICSNSGNSKYLFAKVWIQEKNHRLMRSWELTSYSCGGAICPLPTKSGVGVPASNILHLSTVHLKDTSRTALASNPFPLDSPLNHNCYFATDWSFLMTNHTHENQWKHKKLLIDLWVQFINAHLIIWLLLSLIYW